MSETPSTLERLHPAVAHHIVNSLGWRSLRPLQEMAVEQLVGGGSALLLAPTAGGKTEAATLPLWSRMLSEDWRGLSVLYVCPLRALLNNLHPRLEQFGRLLGRRVGLWHGDVGASQRKRILADPPDVLLTTPESIEVMLVSRSTEPRLLFQQLQALVVDEIHAFAGDDRGWHLLSVLERVQRFAGRELQRVGLSATVGNPEHLLAWLTASADDAGVVLSPPRGDQPEPEVLLDHVGTLDNAARVIASLHRGEKRLVFVDSRNRVEQLGTSLRAHGVTTYLSHASLSRDERQRAETAFQESSNCVIVATSTLELGIDVGDLDRVLQIDAPPNVASMLQRLGRTGRRAGTVGNTTILTTSAGAALTAAGVVRLWEQGYVEPVEPPPLPLHVLAQQLMGLCLQQGGLAFDEWVRWIGMMPGFTSTGALAQDVVDELIRRDILWQEGGILWFGKRGEKDYGQKHFMEVLSVITSTPTLEVRWGREVLGVVDEAVLFVESRADTPLLLGGRAWKVLNTDWRRRVCQVEPTEIAVKGFWLGQGRPLSFAIAQSIQSVLAAEDHSANWSRRFCEAIDELRLDHPWATESRTFLEPKAKEQTWWTFAGQRFNTLAALAAGVNPGKANSLAITLDSHHVPEEVLAKLVQDLEGGALFRRHPEFFQESFKFQEALSEELAMAEVAARWCLNEELEWVSAAPIARLRAG